MTLAEDLLDKQGHVLLPSGMSITAGMLKSLAQHDIHTLCVVAQWSPEEIRRKNQREDPARIEQLFHKHGAQDAATHQLKLYVRRYHLGKIA